MKDNAGLSAIYCTGIIGAFIYYWQTTIGVGDKILGAIKSLFWPGVLVYEAMQMLKL
jgi:hypothetical protein